MLRHDLMHRFRPEHLTVWVDPSTGKKTVAKYEFHILSSMKFPRHWVPLEWIKKDPEYYLGYWNARDWGYIQA